MGLGERTTHSGLGFKTRDEKSKSTQGQVRRGGFQKCTVED